MSKRTSFHLRKKVVSVQDKTVKKKSTSEVDPQEGQSSSSVFKFPSPQTSLPKLVLPTVFQRSAKTPRSPPATPASASPSTVAEDTTQPTTPLERSDLRTPVRSSPISLGVTPIIEEIRSLPTYPESVSSTDSSIVEDQPSVVHQSPETPSQSSEESSRSSPRATMAMVPFAEIYKDIPKCQGEPHIVSHFISICDGLYDDFFANSTPSRDHEYIRLLSIKLSPEIYTNIRGQNFNTYEEFRNAILNAVTPEVSLADAITAIQRMTIHPKESLKEFGKRVAEALNVLNNAYTVHMDGNLPQSLKDSNTRMAIDTYANSIRNNDIRILLLARNFANLSSAITFAESRLKVNTSKFQESESNQRSSNDSSSNANHTQGHSFRNQSRFNNNQSQNNNRNSNQNSQNNQSSQSNQSFQNNQSSQINSNRGSSDSNRSFNSSQNRSFNNSRSNFNTSRGNSNTSQNNSSNTERTIFIPRGGDFDSTALYHVDQEMSDQLPQNISGNENRSTGLVQDHLLTETQ